MKAKSLKLKAKSKYKTAFGSANGLWLMAYGF